jgi:hypothetical protein
MTKRNRLFLDVETPPIPVWVFSLNDKSNARISYKNIVSGYSYGIICACWKWAGTKKVHSLDWGQKQNDKELVRGMIAAMDSADEICMQNGNRFDVRWIRGRAIYHRLPMRPTYATIDTLLKSRQKFHFPSFRLDYMGNHLLDDEKIPTSFGLWKTIMEDRCPISLQKMIRYCKKDVRLLEDLFNVIAPYIEPVSSVAEYSNDCPECGNPKTTVKGYRTRATGNVYVQLLCKKCPKWFGVPLSKFRSDKKLAGVV